MTKMMVVDKQFLKDIYGTSYEICYDHHQNQECIREVFNYPCRRTYATVEEAYDIFVLKSKMDSKQKVTDFDERRNTMRGRIKMIKYALGLLPKKNMKYLKAKLVEIEECRQLKNIPAMETLVQPLGEQFLISESFIRPDQKLYVFVKAHNIHFASYFYEAFTYLVGVNVCRSYNGEPACITMKVDIHSVPKEGEETQHFRINWDDFKRFNDDYLTTDTTGQFVFTDKEKCLAFAKEMMNKDIQKIKNNMNSLAM